MFLSLKTLYRKRTVIWPFYFYTIIRTLSTGMGLKGDQVLDKNQNKVLANSKSNFVKIHLFETFKPKEHTYLGEVYLAGQIYTVNEKDSSGNSRKVYKFPLALINQEQLIEDKDI